MLIYISAPYSNGRKSANVYKAIKAGDALLAKGHIPCIPHLNHFWDMISPKPWEEWLRIDLELMSMCDAVLRLPGSSIGADREVELALRLCIMVYYDINDIPQIVKE